MSLALGYLFRSEVGRDLRLEGRRSAIPDERWITSLQWHQATSIEVHFEATKATRPNRGGLSGSLATMPGGRIPG